MSDTSVPQPTPMPDSQLPSQRRRPLRRLIARTLLVLLVALALLMGWLLGTQSGAQTLVTQVLPRLPINLVISEVDGRLWGPLQLKGIALQNDSLTLRVASLDLNWRPFALFSSTVEIDFLRLQGLDVQLLLNPNASEEPFRLPQSLSLPVDIQLRELTVNELNLKSGATEIYSTQSQLVASWEGERFTLSRVELGTPEATITASGDATLAGDYPLQLTLAGQGAISGYAPFSGQLELAGSLQDLAINLVLSPPYATSIDGTIAQLLDTPSVDILLVAAPERLRGLNAELPAAELRAKATAKGPLTKVAVAGQVRYAADEQPTIAADWQAEVQPTSALLNRLDIRIADQPEPLVVTGNVDWADGLRAQLLAQAQRLQLPFGDRATFVDSLRLSAVGDLQSYEISGSTQWEFADQLTPISLRGVGTQTQFTLETLRFGMDEINQAAQLLVTGEIAWNAGLRELELAGTDIDPGRFVTKPQGRLNLQANVGIQGDTGATPTVTLQELDLDGELGGKPMRVQGSAVLQDTRLQIDDLTAVLADTRIAASGVLADSSDFTWSVTAENLAEIGEVFALPLAGSLQGNGGVRGASNNVNLSANVRAANLGYADTRIDAFDLDANLYRQSESMLKIVATGISLAQQQISEFQVRVDGTQAQHKIALLGQADGIDLQAQLDGSWQQTQRWQFVANQLDLWFDPSKLAQPGVSGEVDATRRWLLETPVAGWFQADDGQFALEQGCLAQVGVPRPGRICVAAESAADTIAAEFSLANLRLDVLNAWLPADLRVAGEINGKGKWLGLNNATTAAFELSNLSLAVQEENQWRQALAFEPGEIRLQPSSQANDTLSLLIHLPLDGQGLHFSGQFEPQSQNGAGQWPIQGELQVQLPSLDWVSVFTEEAQIRNASLDGKVKFGGQLDAPELDGRYQLSAQTIDLATPGLVLTDTALTLEGDYRALSVQGSTMSGGETLSFDGRLSWQQGLVADGRLLGSNVLVSDSTTAQVRVSPDLKFNLAEQVLKLRGGIAVPMADVRLRAAPAGAVAISADQELVGTEEVAPPEPPIAVDAQVKLTLGDAVSFKGLGLSAKFAGELAVNDKPGRVTSAQGEIQIVDGQYQAYGQDLAIERGRLLFAGGPIANPGLSVRAVRQATPDVSVGVDVSGTLREPKLEVFSNPSLPESDQLSYLVLGRPMSGGSASERSALEQAALALGVKGGNLITEQIGGSLGLDEIGIESEPGASNEQAALVIGKYLSPRLYVSYGYGLFEPISTLRMEYKLSRLWRVVTESTNEATGGDLQWVLEK